MQRKNILVVGASQGIGRDVAEYLLEQGANVIAVARQKEKLEELKNISPQNVWIYEQDISDFETIENIFLYCKDNQLKLNGMVYCAGVVASGPIKTLEMETLKHTYDVNLMGFAQTSKYFSMKKYSYDGSSIVAMSSVAAKYCDKGMADYASSKVALNAFASVLSKELVKRKIRVNTIGPAMVKTNMLNQSLESIEGFEERVLQGQPFGVIPVRQVSYMVEFLLSEKAEYVTGAYIPITAGSSWPL